MVDELRRWPGAKRPFHAGSCHMTTDGSLEELHDFALRLGMQRAWFQDHHLAPHYDLTPSRRIVALNLGAEFVPAKEQVRRRRLERS